jgi:hypothetical protein
MPEHYLLIADLAMVACPQNIGLHDSSFKRIFQEVLSIHDEVLRRMIETTDALRERGVDVTCQWGFSWQFIDLLYASFPYNSSYEIPWVSDLIVDFNSFLDRTSKTLLNCPDDGLAAEIQQEWLPANIQQELIQAWLELVAYCTQISNTTLVIASSDRMPGINPRFSINGHEHEIPILHIPVEWMNNLEEENISNLFDPKITFQQFFYQVGIFNLFVDWQKLYLQVNPWAKENLPLIGAVHFIPARHWRPGNDFPAGSHCSFRPCFMDHRGRNWEWDRTELHWDVQNNPPQRGCYFNVSPDGQVLHINGRANAES